jgi:hypothetical protein
VSNLSLVTVNLPAAIGEGPNAGGLQHRFYLAIQTIRRFIGVFFAHGLFRLLRAKAPQSAAQDEQGRLIQGIDAEDVRFPILDQLQGQQLPTRGSGKIRVVPVRFPKGCKFDSLVIVPPRVASRFEHQCKRLRLATYWIEPAYHGEFQDGANGKEFWHQVYRKDGWRVVVVRWDRTRKTEPVFDA